MPSLVATAHSTSTALIWPHRFTAGHFLFDPAQFQRRTICDSWFLSEQSLSQSSHGRSFIVHSDQASASDSPFEVADDVDEAALARVMRVVPLGAGVLAGGAVALLVLGYLLIYLLVFIPRGTVG